jgi:uncharacterized protein
VSDSPIAVLSRAECLERLRQQPVGRIGITIGALPVILPVNFTLVDGAITFRTVPGTKLSAATTNAVVAFEVDACNSSGESGWSVLVQGVASEITEPSEVNAALDTLEQPWGVRGDADRIVRIDMQMISGRAFGAESAA